MLIYVNSPLTSASVGSNSSFCPVMPDLSGMESIIWLWGLSPKHRMVAISRWVSSFSPIPTMYVHKIVIYLSTENSYTLQISYTTPALNLAKSLFIYYSDHCDNGSESEQSSDPIYTRPWIHAKNGISNKNTGLQALSKRTVYFVKGILSINNFQDIRSSVMNVQFSILLNTWVYIYTVHVIIDCLYADKINFKVVISLYISQWYTL